MRRWRRRFLLDFIITNYTRRASEWQDVDTHTHIHIYTIIKRQRPAYICMCVHTYFIISLTLQFIIVIIAAWSLVSGLSLSLLTANLPPSLLLFGLPRLLGSPLWKLALFFVVGEGGRGDGRKRAPNVSWRMLALS